MRYFRRSGPSVTVQESVSLGPRWVEGPISPSDDNPDGTPGATVSFDEFYPDQAQWASQIARTPGWYEVDGPGPDAKPVAGLYDDSAMPVPVASGNNYDELAAVIGRDEQDDQEEWPVSAED